MESRIVQVRNLLVEKDVEGILLSKPENRRYASGFTGSAGFVLITQEEALFLTDFRYLEQAAIQCQGYRIVEISRIKPITDVLLEMGLTRIAIEEDYVSYGQALEYQEKIPQVQLVPLQGALTKMRSVKTPEEVEKIRKAAAIADAAYTHILTYVKPGMTELQVALELEAFMKQRGASKLSFDTIVASGVRSALPHGVASEKVIEMGDMVTLDFGCVYQGYCSDMTRTFVMGKATEKQKELYYTVLEANEKALKAVAPGMKGVELDAIARDFIKEKGYGDYFGHGLGHGVGLEIHELPHVNMLGETPMAPGMIITIEPGIYLPNYGGVRIEDLVVVTETGYEVLSHSSKELFELTF